MKEEADQAFAAYEQELADARGKAHEIAQAARDSAKAGTDAERVKVEAEMTEKIEKAEAEIASVTKKAMAEVDSIAADTTAAIVKQLIGGSVTKANANAAVKAAAQGGE